MRTLRVAIDCRIDDPRQGTGTAVLALAHGLSKLDRNQKYTFIVFEDLVDWLRPYVSGPCSIKGMPRAPRSTLRKFASKQRALRFLWGKINRSVGASDGWIESQGFDVVHFPTQAAYLTRVPSIYQPWICNISIIQNSSAVPILRRVSSAIVPFAHKPDRCVCKRSGGDRI